MASFIGKVHKCNVNPGAANAFRNSAPIIADLEAKGKAIAQRAQAMTPEDSAAFDNPDYVVRSRTGSKRASVAIIAANPRSIKDNRDNNTLLKAMD